MQVGCFVGSGILSVVGFTFAYHVVSQGDRGEGGETGKLYSVGALVVFQHRGYSAILLVAKATNQCFEYRLGNVGVVVDEKEVVATGHIQSGIVSSGKAIVDILHHFHLGINGVILPELFRLRGLGTIVHHDDFEGIGFIQQERVNHFAGVVEAVVVDGDDGD